MKKGGKGHGKYDKEKEEKKEKAALWQNRYIQKMKNATAGFSMALKVIFGIVIVLIILTILFFIGYGLYKLGVLIYNNYQTRSAEGLTLMDWFTNPIAASEELFNYGMSAF
jgi:hypothetical protein